jgi:hypothetical protein
VRLRAHSLSTPKLTAPPPWANSFLNLEGWENNLPRTDIDFEYIMTGVQDGFNIVDKGEFAVAEVNNYASVTSGENRYKAEQQIQNEIVEGRYVVVKEKPTIVSALGAIPKPNGDIRLIHDGSRPAGKALNDYASLEQRMRFQSLEDATHILHPGAYMAKVDLKSAYRSVKVHPSNWPACGLKWTFEGKTSPTYMVDTALPFGSRRAPGHFHKLTQAVRRMMARKGYQGIVAYLDDFLIVERSQERCLQAQNSLILLLRELGFSIAWNKVEGPTKSLVFLGVNIDSVKGCLELPPEKLAEFHTLVKETRLKKRISLKQLQVLAGKVNWTAMVVHGGRIYLRKILDVMKPLRASHHRVRHDDLRWWDNFLCTFNGRTLFAPTLQWVNVYVDVSLTEGGMAWGKDWSFVDWQADFPAAAKDHINVEETLAIGMAVRHCAPQWVNASAIIHTDNITAKAAINKVKALSKVAMDVVREIFWRCTMYNFKIRVMHIPGKLNL